MDKLDKKAAENLRFERQTDRHRDRVKRRLLYDNIPFKFYIFLRLDQGNYHELVLYHRYDKFNGLEFINSY